MRRRLEIDDDGQVRLTYELGHVEDDGTEYGVPEDMLPHYARMAADYLDAVAHGRAYRDEVHHSYELAKGMR